MHGNRAAVLSSLLCVVAPFVAAQDTFPTATIDAGPVVGRTTSLTESSSTVNQFLGIPFAEPPVRDLRFEPPQEISSWDTPLEVQEQPNACRQWLGPPGDDRDRREALFYNPPPRNESEDCLYLNVYAPQGGEDDKAVFFWIYGGSGINGAISLPLYDGTNFAANQDVVVIAANYRVNGTVEATTRRPADTGSVWKSHSTSVLTGRTQSRPARYQACAGLD